MFLFEPLIILLVSVICAGLVFYNIPINYLNQIAMLLLVVLLFFLSKYIFVKGKTTEITTKKKLSLVFLTSFLVQIIVVSTGGFYSPLLILIHLYTLASGFMLRVTTATTFLVFTLLILGGQLFWNESINLKFKEDPALAAIYLASFIIVVPLAQFIMRTYKLKEKMSKVLSEYLNIGQQREVSILSGMSELVFITDKNLKIISISESAQLLLGVNNEEVKDKFFLEQVNIVNQNGVKVSTEQFPINEILIDKAVRIVSNMHLITQSGHNTAVTIQIKPIKDVQGEVSQLIFIITDARLSLDTQGHHEDLKTTLLRYQQSLNNLRGAVSRVNNADAQVQLEVLSHIEEDMRFALEIEDHPVKEDIYFEDVAFLGKQSLEQKKVFAQKFGVNMQFILDPNEISERSWLELKEQDENNQALGKSDFTVPVDPSWFKLLMQKLLDLGILLASGQQPMSKVDMAVSREEGKVIIVITAYINKNSIKDANNLLLKNYGGFDGNTNLRYGSGVEGFLAQAIALELKIKLSARVFIQPSRLEFTVEVPVKP